MCRGEEKPPLFTVSLSFSIAPAVVPVGPAPRPAVPPLPAAAAAPAITALPAQDKATEQQPALVAYPEDKQRILSSLYVRLRMTPRHDT